MNKRRLLLLVLCVLAAALFTGCSGSNSTYTADTVMTADSSFAGTRTITADIPASDIRRFFGNSVSELNAYLEEQSDDTVSYAAQQQLDGGAQLTMTVKFGSISDYQKAIDSLTADYTEAIGCTPAAIYKKYNSDLKKGYTFSENFTSDALLYKLTELLENNYDKLQGDCLFTAGTGTLTYDGSEVITDSDKPFSFSDLSSDNSFSSISVTAELKEDGSFGGEVDYTISNGTVAALKDSLGKMMENLTPEGASMTYADGGTSRIYTLTFQAASQEDFVTDVNKALHTQNCAFTVETESGGDTLEGQKTVEMYFDTDYFTDSGSDSLPVTYVLKTASNYSADSCTGKYGYLDSHTAQYVSNQLYLEMPMSRSDDVSVELGFAIDIESVDISTTIHSEKNIVRVVTLKLPENTTDIIGSSIKQKLTAAASDLIDSGKVEISEDKVVSTTQYTITMNASSSDEMTAMTREIFGEPPQDADTEEEVSGHSEFDSGIKPHTNPLVIRYETNDTINLSSFLSGSFITEGITYSLTYPQFYTASFSDNTIFEDASASGATVSGSTYNKIISIKSVAETINVTGVVLIALALISLVIVVFMLIRYSDHFVYYVRNHKPDIPGSTLFHGKPLKRLTLFCIALVMLVIAALRLLLKIY
ncbi:MAG: hypothetical protein ACOX74_05860 [Lachnospiraceae bacterium]|jgi:hypothetical protein